MGGDVERRPAVQEYYVKKYPIEASRINPTNLKDCFFPCRVIEFGFLVKQTSVLLGREYKEVLTKPSP